MADRIELAFRRAAGRLIPDNASVLAAVSGGGDSVALLHLLRRFAAGRPIAITVAHLDHGLRRGSRADRVFVERLSRELELPVVSERREVGALRRRGESPQESARRVRREFLLEAAARSGCGIIATGHTLDDQAETVLMRLVRGAGATALTGMAVSGPGPIVRPLLGIERRELRAYLERRGLAHREDPSNRDLRFDRNRVRRLILPVLAETLNPRAAKHLVRAARRIREDAVHLDEVAQSKYDELTRRDRRGRLVLEAVTLSELSPPVARRLAALVLRRAGVDSRRVASRHVEGLIDLAHGRGGRCLDLPNGMLARRDGRRLSIGLNGKAR